MDGIRNRFVNNTDNNTHINYIMYRYQSIQDKFSPRAETIKSELDQATTHFEQCQVGILCMIFLKHYFVHTGHLCYRPIFFFEQRKRIS